MGTNVNYICKGRGQSIVLLHGWGGSSESLKPLQDILSKRFQVLNLDLPGFGDSPEPKKVLGVEQYANLIIDLTKKLKIHKFHLFGHSFGGQIAAKMALDYPSHVQSLILCSGAVVRKRSIGTKVIIKLAELLKHSKLSLILTSVKKKLDYTKASPKMRLIMNKILMEDLTSEIANIALPTLILWGAHDKITPVWQANLIHNKIRNSKLKIYQEARHGLPLKQADLVAADVEEFIVNGS